MKLGFSRQNRLISFAQIKEVLKQKKINAAPVLALYFSPNNLPQTRLGIICAKKNVPLAAERNRFKRLVREFFRLNQEKLTGLDLVVVAYRQEKIDSEKINLCLKNCLGKLISS
jgi:ribonuclease P protein component